MNHGSVMRKRELVHSQKELSELIGPAGRERAVRDYLYSRLESVSDELSVDGAGNLIAVIEGKNAGLGYPVRAPVGAVSLLTEEQHGGIVAVA